MDTGIRSERILAYKPTKNKKLLCSLIQDPPRNTKLKFSYLIAHDTLTTNGPISAYFPLLFDPLNFRQLRQTARLGEVFQMVGAAPALA